MTAPVSLAGQHIAASTAGHTGSSPAPLPAGPTVAEAITTGGLDLGHLFSGGIHPEGPLVPLVDTSIQTATDSVRGALGGLQPRRNGVLAPGPAGSAAHITEQVRATAAAVPGWLDRVRGYFRGPIA